MPLGKVLIPLHILRSLLRPDGVTLTGVEYNSVDQIVSLGVESPNFPDFDSSFATLCRLDEKDGRLIVVHPRGREATHA